jgi:predicted metalloprotease with PDZ domain
MTRRLLAAAIVLLSAGVEFRAQTAIRYRFSFPEPQHRWMQVEAAFSGIGAAPLELRMSRSSPGRYSVHDFAKNVYSVEASDAAGRPLPVARPDAHGWTIEGHGGSVLVRYKVFGDRVDGTYLAVDPTHAHINMPAAIMWARGHEDRAATLVFEPPAPRAPAGDALANVWHVATQLFPGATPFEFTAPNLQYLMDSPVEIGPLAIRPFDAAGQTVRVALHHTGSEADVDALVRDVQKIVAQQGAMFGEYPAFEPGRYTFMIDLLPHATADAMEHRNSTVITSPGTVGGNRLPLLESVAHEFFHVWNIERIRPRSLEPFDFDRANMSGELWLGEGFTEYYAPLTLSRAGLADVQDTAATLGALVSTITTSAGRLVRSAEEMSRMAVFTDGGRPVDRTNWSNTYLSYYPFGAAIALGLDLTLRERSGGRVALDDFMRAMWRAHGKPGGSRPGHVDRPYTSADAEARLAEVTGDAAFARSFFARYVRGREIPDYTQLFSRAGLLLRKVAAGRAWWGDVGLERRAGTVYVTTAPPANSPAYAAGLDVGDSIVEIEGRRVSAAEDIEDIVSRRRPGDIVALLLNDRSGASHRKMMTLAENPHLELVPVEATGAMPDVGQKAFRAQWLGSN